MRIIVASDAGFCFGVKRATKAAFEAAAVAPGPVYTLGELIHNPQVVKQLEQMGVRVAGACRADQKLEWRNSELLRAAGRSATGEPWAAPPN